MRVSPYPEAQAQVIEKLNKVARHYARMSWSRMVHSGGLRVGTCHADGCSGLYCLDVHTDGRVHCRVCGANEASVDQRVREVS